MRHRLFPEILLFVCILAGGTSSAETTAARVKVALLDGEPVYHWVAFRSKFQNDIDRALILRAWRRGGYTLPKHYIDEQINSVIQERFDGDRAKLLEGLNHVHATLDELRQFTAEELKAEAMLKYVTVHGKYGEAAIPEAKWLASLRKGSEIKMIK